ncbi:MAG: DUF4091 domain-containing protein, partial [bacterium]|nr:DUF4091 domain-containing protein [bacterium]
EGYPFKNPAGRNRQKAINYLRSAYEWFDALGVAHKVYLLPGDEPSSRRELKKIRDVAQVARDAHPEYRVSMTLSISNERTRDYLFGTVNAPVAHYGEFDPVQARIKRSAGDEVWTYTAVVENPDNPTPYWQLDFPLLNYRIVPWINYRYEVNGFLYWATAVWGTAKEKGVTPWEDACSYDVGWACFNGEGLLLYPGREVNYVVPGDAYGAAVYGAVPSLRIKAFRDAMEDYEYLVLASEANRVDAERDLYEIACNGDATRNCFQNWNPNPAALLAARERLGELIETAGEGN